ncbi:hypothetical protein [Massilia sp. CF038]|uniref:hypothetical protein n=1 Tax=Massilia sp. CF038 TaxID=1881045 RepID=UPI000932DA3E|nr:hypothetical protein [Massilia sp. CF038]
MKDLKELLKFLLVIFVLIGSFAVWSWWDVRSVRGFCGDAKPGTLVIALPSLAENHHLDTHWVRSKVIDKEKGAWIIFLPAKTTFGDVVCKIEHDNTVVLSSRMDGI